ncbi:MAG: M48 family metalloprotease [Pseudomonadota bacterium]
MLRALFLTLIAASLSVQPIAAAQQADSEAQAEVDPTPSSFDYVPQGEDERGLWMRMDEQERKFQTSDFIIRDEALNDYVNQVLCRTVGADRCQRTRVYLVRTPDFNATMAPNGMMQVWTGLLLRVQNEAQLAGILAHEFAHFEEQHGLKQFRAAKAKSDAAMWVGAFTLGLGSIFFLGDIFSFSREMEKEADIHSIAYITEAGYDSRQVSLIWKNLRAEQDATAEARKQKSRKDKNGGFFATHPNTLDRMTYLADLAGQQPEGGFVGEAEYRAALAEWWPRLIDDQIKRNDFGGTLFLLDQLAEDGENGVIAFARGELYRARGREGDFALAIQSYQQSIATGIDIPENWRGLGLAQMRNGQKEEGRLALREYLKRQPDASDRAMLSMMAGGV